MSLSLIALLAVVVLVAGYLGYGSFIARRFNLDDARLTPAAVRNDGVDFIPTRPFYLFGQHFSAIAAAGPIAGPILACAAFGWLPCLLWILLGVVFIGAVHDFVALVASIRHGGHSIAHVAREHLGRRAYLALVAFIWLALLYVITAFTQITAQTFVGQAEEFEGLATPFNVGGAVAMSSVLYLALALVMGVVVRTLRPPMWGVTLVFVPATLGCVYLGTLLDDVLVLGAQAWVVLILAYCFIAAQLPVWLLQQPRGYLGGFVLFLALGVGVVGLLAGGYGVQQPAMTEVAWRSLNPLSAWEAIAADPAAPAGAALTIGGLILPFLFVTIACGACSGFHGLICGGTTSRQLAKESHAKPMAFGAMLLEGLVAIIALATIMILSREQAQALTPARIYGDGLASFVTLLLGPQAFIFAATFGAMAFSTFVFDTLDVSARLGRYLLQELFGAHGPVAGVIATGATVLVPLLMLVGTDPGAYRAFWTLFGTSNQLLAALTLLGVSVWLLRSGRRAWATLLPMVFVMTITLWALVLQIVGAAVRVGRAGAFTPAGTLDPQVLNGAIAVVLLGLALMFIRDAARALRGPRSEIAGSLPVTPR